MATRDETNAGDGTHGFIEQISSVRLPETVGDLAREYADVFGDRDRFLWQWIYSLFPEFTLSSVAEREASHLRTQKTILTMYVTILDDLVETHEDRRTFEEARRLARGEQADPERVAVDPDQFAFIERVWQTFEAGLADAPRREAFADIFEYDLQQTTNAVDYSAVLNAHPSIANLDGAKRYDAHNMAMFPYADLDLMYSPAFDLADFGALRDLLWDLQELARIGNWLTTWEREVRGGDYTAGVVVLALEEGIVTPAQLRSSEDVIETIENHDIERRFERRWRSKYRAVNDRDYDISSVDIDALVEGMGTVFEYHRASRGYK
jgi:hypothetical protein